MSFRKIMHLIAEQNKIQEALERGVEKIYPSKEALQQKLASGQRLKLYCGYDPTATSLHLGHTITLRKLAQFQALGHEVIMLIGDFTAIIGDPTDKTATRKQLTRQQVKQNLRNYQKQAAKILNFAGANPAQVIFNSQWHDKLSFVDLIELATNFTVGQMLVREMFQERMKKSRPIFLHEFLYPLAQAYDSVALDVDLEIGGNDQTFNMLCGRDLMKALKNKEKFVLTMKLLTDAGGKKMGKTEGNMITLDETPENIFGKIMSWPDEMLMPGFELCTDMPLAQVKEIGKQLKTETVNPRDLKMQLALEIVKQFHSETAAKISQEQFVKTFQKKEIPDEIPVVKINQNQIRLDELLVKAGLTESKSDAKRLIQQRAVKINQKLASDFQAIIEIPDSGILLQKGRRFFVKIRN